MHILAMKKSKSKFDVLKLKEFKIHGVIGGSDKSKNLTHSTLKFQINSGLKLGFGEEAICAAVLKAISPGNNLRTYLETKGDLTVASLLETLQYHCHEKNAAHTFTELCNARQEQGELCLDFVIRAMALRQKVLVLDAEEGDVFDEKLVQIQFVNTLEVGIQNLNIRTEISSVLKKKKVTDQLILKAVTEAVSRENERSGKHGTKSVNAVTQNFQNGNEYHESTKTKNPNYLPNQILELKATQEKEHKELVALRTDMCEIKSLLLNKNDGSNDSNDKPRFQRKKFLCPDCTKNKAQRCNHCFRCGSTQHRMVDCTVQKNSK